MERVFTIIFVLFMLGVFLVLSGALLNFLVVRSNNNKMPIIYNDLEQKISTKKHTFINSKENIKYYYLADIFRLTFKKFSFFFSLGDILIIFGNVLGIVTYVYLLYIYNSL